MPGMGIDADPVSAYFAGLNPYNTLGVKPAAAVAPAQPGTGAHQLMGAGSGMDALSTTAPLWSPQNPLFWFGGVLLATFGLIGVSVAGRVGPARASASVGDTGK